MRVNLKCTAVEVRNPASRIAKGAPETTGAVRYKVTGSADGQRVYLALGTDHKGTAERRVRDIETACVIGPDARTWNDAWLALEERLPKKTFDYFAGKAGYEKAERAKVSGTKPTWAILRASYEAALDRKILDGDMVESSKVNYLQTLKEFDKFVQVSNITFLDQITDDTITEEFKPWRKRAILSSKQSGKKASRLAFDLTILRAVFNHTKSKAWIRAGFAPLENPVPATKKDQKPGANPENKTMPFTAEELTKLQATASLKYIEDSKGRKYALKFGTDLLAFELLRRTGLRRCDAATLQWKHIRFDMGEGMLQVSARKNGEPIFMPIHKGLAPLLRAEKARRNPSENETVLVSPDNGKAYDINGKRLYARLMALGKRVGINKVRPHRFRCNFAVDALLKGANVNQIAEWLGDTTETVAKHYLPISTAMSESTRNILDRDDAGIDALKALTPSDKVTQMKSNAA
jgi:integrase